MSVEITMLPTSVRVSAGHRLRLSFAGFDRDSFARIPAKEIPEFAFKIGNDSFLDLAVVEPTTPSTSVRIPVADPDPFGLSPYRGRYQAADESTFANRRAIDSESLVMTVTGPSPTAALS